MASDDGVRLRAYQQAYRHLQIARVKQRALPFHHVPMVGAVVRRQHFGGTGQKVRHDGIQRQPTAGNHDAGLASGAEITLQAAALHFSIERQRGVFLAAGAVRADGEQPHAGALAPTTHRQARRRHAHIDKPNAALFGCSRQARQTTEPDMQPGHHVQTQCRGFAKRRHPVVGNPATHGRRTDDEAACARRFGFSQRILRNAGIHAASWKRYLADAVGRAPLRQTETGLGKSGVLGVAEKNHERRVEMNDIFHFGKIPDITPPTQVWNADGRTPPCRRSRLQLSPTSSGSPHESS